MSNDDEGPRPPLPIALLDFYDTPLGRSILEAIEEEMEAREASEKRLTMTWADVAGVTKH